MIAYRRLAAARATTIPEVLRELVQRAEDDELLGGMEADSDRLASDPEQAAGIAGMHSYQAEVAAWDVGHAKHFTQPTGDRISAWNKAALGSWLDGHLLGIDLGPTARSLIEVAEQ